MRESGIYQMYLKNLLDRLLALVGTAALSWLLILLGIAIHLDSPGPIFFRQKRAGKNGTYFYIYKYRTMRIDTPHDMPTHMLNNPDLFITRVGRFLRKTSLDELPQLFNILKGVIQKTVVLDSGISMTSLWSVSSTAQTASVRVLPDGHRSMDGMSCRSGKKLNWMDIMCTISSSKWIWNVSGEQQEPYCGRMEFTKEDWKNSRCKGQKRL